MLLRTRLSIIVSGPVAFLSTQVLPLAFSAMIDKFDELYPRVFPVPVSPFVD